MDRQDLKSQEEDLPNQSYLRKVEGAVAGSAICDASRVRILGVDIMNLAQQAALDRLCDYLDNVAHHAVFFANAHTLNLAARDFAYQQVLNGADMCLGDGVGVRLAAASRGVTMQANLNGTDLVPAFLSRTEARNYRYFLLGLDEASIERAAQEAQVLFPGWTLAGFHHGYLNPDLSENVIRSINASESRLLLVGMGNPLQEKWISEFKDRLNVSLSLAVGGLLDYWAGNLQRAPLWMRRFELEWLYILGQQPRKFRRYMIGNWIFLGRAFVSKSADGF